MRALLSPRGQRLRGESPQPFPLRDPFMRRHRQEPGVGRLSARPTTTKTNQQDCAPEEYVSPFIWDQRRQHGVRAAVARARRSRSPARRATRTASTRSPTRRGSRTTATRRSHDDGGAAGACKPEDMLPGPTGEGRRVDHRSRQGQRLDARLPRRCPRQGQVHAQGRRHRQAGARERRERDRRGDLRRARLQHDAASRSSRSRSRC